MSEISLELTAHDTDGHTLEVTLASFSPYKDLLEIGSLLSLDQYLRKFQIPETEAAKAKEIMTSSADYKAAQAMERLVDKNYQTLDQLTADLEIIGDRPLKLDGLLKPESGSATLTGYNTAESIRELRTIWPELKKKLRGVAEAKGKPYWEEVERGLADHGITTSHDIRTLVWNLLDHQEKLDTQEIGKIA